MRQVTAAVIIEENKLLLARRSPGQKLAGYWELPGGKVEPGETPEECLERELAEELSMLCSVGDKVALTQYAYDHGTFEMLAYRVERLSEYNMSVHDACQWATVEELASLPVAPADIELIRQLLAKGYLGADSTQSTTKFAPDGPAGAASFDLTKGEQAG